MRRILFVPAFLLLGACAAPEPPKDAFAPVPLRRDVVGRNVFIVTTTADERPLTFGTGVLYDHERVVTALHVVRNASKIFVTVLEPADKAGSIIHTLPAQRVHAAPEHDVAVLGFSPDKPLDLVFSDTLPPLRFLKGPLVATREVFVQDRHPEPGWKLEKIEGTILPAHTPLRLGAALSPTQINVSGEPGSSGAGVFAIQTLGTDQHYALAGLIVSRTTIPPTFYERKAVPQPDGGVRYLDIYLTGRWVTNIVPAGTIQKLLEDSASSD